MLLALLILAGGIAGVPWASIWLIVSLIFLFIAAFISGVGLFRSDANWHARGFSFAWAGMFFYVLSTAVK